LSECDPAVRPQTGNLPPGIHSATWDEVVVRYGYSEHRYRLLTGLRQALDLLRRFGCRRFYLDGSFVTTKEKPGDYDGCWEVEGIDIHRLAREQPLLWDDSRGRLNQKRRFGGDLFPISAIDLFSQQIFLDFQRDTETRMPKGIIVLDLETLL
jgi:hypothetical protein